ncbi:hypothetical protein [Amycolatopsis minnesotensis]|uniref:Uncharacterized protein n=1 Tax=Amycolatopsis minnesotensis TaxID=337894 RepID=A0ABN2Q219_9PSEU
MATQLPVKIDLTLPEGWQPAPPDEVGAPEAAFVALRLPADDGFTTNITVSGAIRDDGATLEAIADESVGRLSGSVGEVDVLTRAAAGTEEAPSYTQTLRVAAELDGAHRELIQCQVYLEMRDDDLPAERAVIELVLTSTVGGFEDFVGEFQEFVRSVVPAGAG